MHCLSLTLAFLCKDLSMKIKLAAVIVLSSLLLSGCFDDKDKESSPSQKASGSETTKVVSYVVRTLESMRPYNDVKINQDSIIIKNADKIFSQACSTKEKCDEFKFHIDSPFVDFKNIESISVVPVYEKLNPKYKNLDEVKSINISSFVQIMTFKDTPDVQKEITSLSQHYVMMRTVFKNDTTPIYSIPFFDYRDEQGFSVHFNGNEATLFAQKESMTKIEHKTLLRFIKDTSEDAVKTRDKMIEENQSQKENTEFWKQSEVKQ